MDIPASDTACTDFVRDAFGIPPITPANTLDYKVFGDCSNGVSGVTIAQIDNSGQILWKALDTQNLNLITTIPRCIVAPLLLILFGWIVIGIIRGKKNEPIPKF